MKIKQYVNKRNKILSEDPVDIEKLKELSVIAGVNFPSDPYVVEIAVHKMRANAKRIPKYLVKKSRLWLVERGFSVNCY